MTTKLKKVYNVKLLYRWAAPQWFTMFFVLLAIAIPIVAFFMPFFQFSDPGSAEKFVVSGKDMVFYLLGNTSDNLRYLLELFKTTWKPQEIGQLMPFALYAPGGLFFLVAFFAIFLLICFFRLLFTGALKMWGAPRGLSIASFIFSIPLYGIPLGISLFYNFANSDPGIPKFDFMFPIIFLGTSFITMICLCINYAAGFKNKEFIPNEMYLDNYVAMITGEERKYSYPNNVITIPPQEEPSTKEHQPGFLKKKEEEDANKNTTTIIEKSVPAAAPTPVVVNVAAPAAPTNNEKTVTKVETITKYRYETLNVLPAGLKAIGGHAFSQNTTLEIASIPNNITSIGNSAFANCVVLRVVEIPSSVTKIGYNAFFHCPKLKRINYSGTMKEWKKVKRGSNWLLKAGTKVVHCSDGPIQVNPYH